MSVPAHFPDLYEKLVAGIKVPRPGALFLVGAGFCGKLYADAIKRKGGIAVDVGSLFDLWAGRFTRPYMNFDAIVSYYRDRLDRGDTKPGCFHAVADYHKLNKEPASEEAVIDAALADNPNLFEFNYRKIALLLQRSAAEAESFARDAAELRQFSGAAIFRTAKLFLIAGEEGTGRALLQLAFNRDPTYEPTLIELANFYMGASREVPADAGLDFLETIAHVASRTTNASLLGQYARLLGARGEFREAIAASDRAVRCFSFDSHIYTQRAAWEQHLGDTTTAARSRAEAQRLEAATLAS